MEEQEPTDLADVILVSFPHGGVGVAKAVLKRVFGLDEAQALRFAEAMPVVVKRQADRDVARRYVQALQSEGAEVRVQPAKSQGASPAFAEHQHPGLPSLAPPKSGPGVAASTDRVDVILQGFPNVGLDAASAALQRLFGIDQAAAVRIAGAMPVVVKHDATSLIPKRYEDSLRRAGADVRVRPAALPRVDRPQSVAPAPARIPTPPPPPDALTQPIPHAYGGAPATTPAMVGIAIPPPAPPPEPEEQPVPIATAEFIRLMPRAFAVPFVGTGRTWMVALVPSTFVVLLSLGGAGYLPLVGLFVQLVV